MGAGGGVGAGGGGTGGVGSGAAGGVGAGTGAAGGTTAGTSPAGGATSLGTATRGVVARVSVGTDAGVDDTGPSVAVGDPPTTGVPGVVATFPLSADGMSASRGSVEAPGPLRPVSGPDVALGVVCSGVNFGVGRSLDRCARSATSSTAPLPPQAEMTIAAPSETPRPVSTLRRLRSANIGSSLGDAGSGGSRMGSCRVDGGTVSHGAIGTSALFANSSVRVAGGAQGGRSRVGVRSWSANVATLLFTSPPSPVRSDRSK